MVYRVTVLPEGIEFLAREGELLYELFARHNYPLRVSCRNGVCQICEVTLLHGIIEQRYPEHYMALDEKAGDDPEIIYACTSKALSDLKVVVDRSN